MNGHTAKDLARAASALALINIARDERASALPPEQRAQAAHLTARKIYRRLKARWRGSNRLERTAMRTRLKHLTMRTKHHMREHS